MIHSVPTQSLVPKKFIYLWNQLNLPKVFRNVVNNCLPLFQDSPISHSKQGRKKNSKICNHIEQLDKTVNHYTFLKCELPRQCKTMRAQKNGKLSQCYQYS